MKTRPTIYLFHLVSDSPSLTTKWWLQERLRDSSIAGAGHLLQKTRPTQRLLLVPYKPIVLKTGPRVIIGGK